RAAVVGDLPGVGVVPLAPEAGAVAGVAAVVDVDGGDADLVAGPSTGVAHHVADARVAGHVHALPVRVGELGRHRPGQAEAEGGDVAPAEVAARDLGLVDGAALVAGVAGVGGEERALGIEHLGEVAEDTIRVDRRLVG